MSGREGSRGKKRPKSYYIKCARKKPRPSHDLSAGMSGFLVTCNTHEKDAVREMYNILNEYADAKFGPEKVGNTEAGSDVDSEEDMEKAMSKEITHMKTLASQARRFQNSDTKTKNCIFIRTTLEDPCSIAHEIFTEIVRTQVNKVRHAIRMIPVSATCRTDMEDIQITAEKIFTPHFETPHGVGLRYTSVCKIRNNLSIRRMTLLPVLSQIIREMNPLHTLDHDEPDLVVVVEIIRNICCLSVVKDYFKFRKYNFHEVVKSHVGEGKEEVEGKETTELKGTDQGNDGNTETVEAVASKTVAHSESPTDSVKETSETAAAPGISESATNTNITEPGTSASTGTIAQEESSDLTSKDAE